MRTRELHERLEELRATYGASFNGFPVGDPFRHVDCSSESGYQNVEHLLLGDRLVYAEIANSTPVKGGYKVLPEFYPLVRKSCRTSCMFRSADLDRMKKSVVGTVIVSRHSDILEFRDMLKCGEVADASLIDGEMNGHRYRTLGILCWIGGGIIDEKLSQHTGMLYLSFGMEIERETCCVCGYVRKKESQYDRCEHLLKQSLSNELFSVCKFERFYEIAVERLVLNGDEQ